LGSEVSYPMLITDGIYHIGAYFTPTAIAKFEKSNEDVGILDLYNQRFIKKDDEGTSHSL